MHDGRTEPTPEQQPAGTGLRASPPSAPRPPTLDQPQELQPLFFVAGNMMLRPTELPSIPLAPPRPVSPRPTLPERPAMPSSASSSGGFTMFEAVDSSIDDFISTHRTKRRPGMRDDAAANSGAGAARPPSLRPEYAAAVGAGTHGNFDDAAYVSDDQVTERHCVSAGYVHGRCTASALIRGAPCAHRSRTRRCLCR